eukprot:1902204-Lingulodinium_polyedra.AAC.1
MVYNTTATLCLEPEVIAYVTKSITHDTRYDLLWRTMYNSLCIIHDMAYATARDNTYGMAYKIA